MDVTPRDYQTLALRRGMMLYDAHGTKPNRAWTPTAMLRTAGNITGKVYKRGQMKLAIADLTAIVEPANV